MAGRGAKEEKRSLPEEVRVSKEVVEGIRLKEEESEISPDCEGELSPRDFKYSAKRAEVSSASPNQLSNVRLRWEGACRSEKEPLDLRRIPYERRWPQTKDW